MDLDLETTNSNPSSPERLDFPTLEPIDQTSYPVTTIVDMVSFVSSGFLSLQFEKIQQEGRLLTGRNKIPKKRVNTIRPVEEEGLEQPQDIGDEPIQPEQPKDIEQTIPTPIEPTPVESEAVDPQTEEEQSENDEELPTKTVVFQIFQIDLTPKLDKFKRGRPPGRGSSKDRSRSGSRTHDAITLNHTYEMLENTNMKVIRQWIKKQGLCCVLFL